MYSLRGMGEFEKCSLLLDIFTTQEESCQDKCHISVFRI
jgi:hypothetical protein